MLPVMVVNRLLRNMRRQRALLPGQGGQLDGHVAELGVVWSVERGRERVGEEGGNQRSETHADEAAYFGPGYARHVAPERMGRGLSGGVCACA